MISEENHAPDVGMATGFSGPAIIRIVLNLGRSAHGGEGTQKGFVLSRAWDLWRAVP